MTRLHDAMFSSLLNQVTIRLVGLVDSERKKIPGGFIDTLNGLDVKIEKLNEAKTSSATYKYPTPVPS